jgi:hypothetical protein
MRPTKPELSTFKSAPCLALCVHLGGCALAPSMLEAGDEDGTGDSQTGESDSGATAEGDCSLEDGCETGGPGFEESCLVGTELDGVGTETSSWAPPCEVVCDEGWGHEGEQLPVAWTRADFHPDGGTTFDGSGLAMSSGGELRLVLSTFEGPTHLLAIDPDSGETEWDEELPLAPATVVKFAAAGSQLYLLRRTLNHTQLLHAFDLDGEHLWSRDYGTIDTGQAMAAGSIGVAVAHEDTLELLDHQGQPVWSATPPIHADALDIEAAPGSRVVVGGDETIVVYSAAGELLWTGELEDAAATSLNGFGFPGGGQVVAAGSVVENARTDGLLTAFDQGALDWRTLYNRALAWCPWPDAGPLEASTAEFFLDIATFDDGSMLLAASENFVSNEGKPGSQPWVGHVSAGGELLASDRGLWDGYAFTVVAGVEGGAYVVASNEDGDPPSLVLRKYLP